MTLLCLHTAHPLCMQDGILAWLSTQNASPEQKDSYKKKGDEQAKTRKLLGLRNQMNIKLPLQPQNQKSCKQNSVV